MNRGAQPDNIYLNVRIQHTDTNSHQSQAKYEITKAQPIVYNMDNYYMSVVEGIIPMNTVPLFIARCIPNPNDLNDVNFMECEIGMVGSDGATIETTHLTYTPQNKGARLPFVPYRKDGVLKNDYSTTYYYIYSIEHLLGLFNEAFETLNNLLNDNGLGYNTTPYFIYNNESETIKLIFPDEMRNIPINAQPYNILNDPQPAPYSPIFINEASHEYLNAFNYYIGNLNMDMTPNFNRYVYFFITNNSAVYKPCNQWGIFDPVIPNDDAIYYIEQEYYALDTAYSVKRVIITTDSIQVNKEFTSDFENGFISNSNTQYPIVLDLSPLNIKNSNVRQIKWVNEFGNNKLADLLSNENLKRITLYIYFQDSFGNNHVLNISKYQNIFIKLAFQNKKLYLN